MLHRRYLSCCRNRNLLPGSSLGRSWRLNSAWGPLTPTCSSHPQGRKTGSSRATDTRAVGEAAAIAVGGTIGLDALLGGPTSGASMNPMHSRAPTLVSGDLHALWLYPVAPVLGTSCSALAYQRVRGEALAGSP